MLADADKMVVVDCFLPGQIQTLGKMNYVAPRRIGFDQDQRDVGVSFIDDASSIRISYETEDPDRDFFEFNLGVTVILPGDIHTL